MSRSNPRRTNGSARDKVLRQVRRSETHCHLCGQAVDVTLPPLLPGSPEVDELTPVAYGGSPYDRTNCRLSHRYCNNLRSHGPIRVAQEALRASPPRFTPTGHLAPTLPQPTTSRTWL